MKTHRIRWLLNFVWYQSIWFTAVLTGNTYLLPMLVLISAHILLVPERGREIAVIALCAGVGIVADSSLALSGFYRFESAPNLLPIPAWLVVVWLAFGGILRHSLRPIIDRPVVALMCGAVFAPLTYFAAARLGAVEFLLPPVSSALLIGSCWASLMLIFSLSQRLVSNYTGFSRPLVQTVFTPKEG